MSGKVTYWAELSDYDMKTAEAMFNTGRYLYVGFMAHQAIEKILKAYFVKIKVKLPHFLTAFRFWQSNLIFIKSFQMSRKISLTFLNR